MGTGRAGVYNMASLFGVNVAARMAFQRRLLVLAYHGVFDGEPEISDPLGLHISKSLFERQLDFLLARYQPVSLAAVRSHFVDGAPLPSRPVLITFDDGYRNAGQNALPVLDRLGVPSVVFVVAGTTERSTWLWHSMVEEHCRHHPEDNATKQTLDRRPAEERRRWIQDHVTTVPRPCDHSLLDWSELLELAKSPLVALGSHCLTHEPLATCDGDEARREIEESKRLLEERLARTVDALAYPHGSYTQAVLDTVRRAGYRVAFTTEPRHARAQDDALTLPRILVGRSDEPTVLAARTAGWQEWVRPLFARVTGTVWQTA
jgi:peptidoglycan/xylan/chitin deacetylase (PgdA/CDA1 family)